MISGFSTKPWLDIGGHDYIFEDRSVAWKMMRLRLQGGKFQQKNLPTQFMLG
jgi:hypothetical protein